jgi:hypothetical protein
MEDTQKAEEKVVETDTTQVTPPVTEEPTTEAKTMDKESVVQGSLTEGVSDLPADVEEQRRAFQEMRQEIKRLKAETETRKKSESAFDSFRVKAPLPVGQVSVPRIEQFINPETGEPNYEAYNHAVNEQVTRQATQSATFAAQETTKEILDEQTARQKYPDLFNDPETEQEIADRWLAAKLRGEELSVVDIAGRVAKRFKQALSNAEKVGMEKALTEVSEKEKAGLAVSGQTTEGSRKEVSAEEWEQLQRKTRQGDDDAITARISKIPWANK